MFKILTSFTSRLSYRSSVLLGAFAFLLLPLSGKGQTALFQQNFEGTPASTYTYTGTPTITSSLTINNTTNNGTPRNAKYYSEATGSNAWNVVTGNANAITEAIVFRNIRFAVNSTGNRVDFLLTALSNGPNKGMLLADRAVVDISTNYGATYYPVALITGNNGTGASNGVVWGYLGNNIAPGTLTATATFDGTPPSPTTPARTYATFTPPITSAISSSSNNITGIGGFGKVSIVISNARNVQLRITLINTGSQQQVWGVDEVKVFSNSATVLAPGLATALPVELTRFKATPKGSTINLDWATASEKDNDRFDVQRSATGDAFETIGNVKGQGNSTTAHDYTFVDSRPLAGLSYYRLRQVDVDGSSDYSPVATVQSAAGQKAIAFPNPSIGTITLPALDGPIQYRIYNNVGQTLLSGQAIGNEQLDIAKISRGTFFLELTSQNGRTTQRLVRE